ncbi:MFS transporter [Sphingobacterium sp.]|uniref:MFS transporter n=1 Tax=Sphingobacterium sp. TaxID=341027 RepID=UPI00289956CE|nr:MFS transporter [Sphingobacterium sp.]
MNVSLPNIQHALHLSNSDTQWIIVLYIVGYASILIYAGNAGNRYGKKKLYLVGMAGFTLASFLCGVSSNLYALLLGRLAQGISAGLMVPQGIALITLLFQNPEKRSMALGIYGSIAGIASVIGQLLGGILPDQTWINDSWRLIFLINVSIGFLAFFAVYRYTPKDDSSVKSSISFMPMLTLFALLMGIIFPLIMGPELKWPLWSQLLLGGTLFFVLLFLKKQQELQQRGYPTLLNFFLFKNRIFNIGLLVALAYYMVQDAYFIINSNYLQNQKNYTSTMTGIAFIYQGIGYVLASVIVSRLIQRYGKIVILNGLGIMILGLLFHLFIFNTQFLDNDQLHALFFFYGIGCGSVLPALMTLALKDLNERFIADASAVYLTIQQLSICLGIACIVGVFLHQKESIFLSWQHISSSYGYSMSLSVILLLIVVCAVACLPSNK